MRLGSQNTTSCAFCLTPQLRNKNKNAPDPPHIVVVDWQICVACSSVSIFFGTSQQHHQKSYLLIASLSCAGRKPSLR